MRTEQLVEYCIRRGYISEKQAPWLNYALKKNIATLFASFPILMLTSYLATPVAACFFYFSFGWIRSRTNGLHAKSFIGCMVASLFCAWFFMGPLYKLITVPIMQALLCLSTVIIWFFSPFDHPNMHLTNEEKIACMNSARRRLLFLLLGANVLHKINQQEAVAGIVLGASMAALLLALAYLFKGEGGEG